MSYLLCSLLMAVVSLPPARAMGQDLGSRQDPLPAPTGEGVPSPAEIDAVIEQLRRLPEREQDEVLAAVRAAIGALEDPYFAALRMAAARAADAVEQRRAASHTELRAPRGVNAPLWAALSFPVRYEYVFGGGGIRPCELDPRHARAVAHGEGLRSRQLCAMLLGYLPEVDLALAGLTERLDHDRSADEFTELLWSWPNGEEPLYRALDRTAGTRQAVFFFDAMLGDFIQKCVPAEHPDRARLTKSLHAAHSALHEAFLAYRQYRGLREAIALALVLPPGAALPAPLARYEAAFPQGYSAREVVAILLGSCGGDVGQVVELVTEAAADLPSGLWDGYDPFPTFQDALDGRLESIVAEAFSTDVMLEEQIARRRAQQELVARTAYQASSRRLRSGTSASSDRSHMLRR